MMTPSVDSVEPGDTFLVKGTLDILEVLQVGSMFVIRKGMRDRLLDVVVIRSIDDRASYTALRTIWYNDINYPNRRTH